MPCRRRDELAEVLCEMEAEHAAKTEKQAAEKLAAERQASEMQIAEKTAQERPVGKAAEERRQAEATRAAEEQHRLALRHAALEQAGRELAKAVTPGKRERRVQSRQEVDTSAVILLINAGSRLQGRIHDLSLSGCRIRTDERFPVGIYTRVETEFRLEGMTFRLGGVIQAVHDRERHSVGIRFLDMSERKREQVEQLIEEIKEMYARQALANAEAAGDTALAG